MSTKAHGPLLEDIRRHIKAAKKEGWTEVTVKYPNGCEVVIRGGDELDAAVKTNRTSGPLPAAKVKLSW